jgi:hypothetical protein
MASKRNLHSLAVLLLILGGSACLFLRQTSGPWCNVAPEVEILEFYQMLQPFNQ